VPTSVTGQPQRNGRARLGATNSGEMTGSRANIRSVLDSRDFSRSSCCWSTKTPFRLRKTAP